MDVSTLFLRLYVPFSSSDSQAKANYAVLSGRYSTSHPMQWSISLHVLNMEDNYLGNIIWRNVIRERIAIRFDHVYFHVISLIHSYPLSDGI